MYCKRFNKPDTVYSVEYIVNSEDSVFHIIGYILTDIHLRFSIDSGIINLISAYVFSYSHSDYFTFDLYSNNTFLFGSNLYYLRSVYSE